MNILCFFMTRPGQIVSRELLFHHLVGRAYDGLDRAIDVRISRLRKHLEQLAVTGDDPDHEVGPGRLEPGGIDLDGEVLAGQRRGLALGSDGGEVAVCGKFPFDRDIAGVASGWGHPCPQHHAVGQRVAAGDAVCKLHGRRIVIAAAAGRQRQGAQRGCSDAELAHEAPPPGIGLRSVAERVGGRDEGFVCHGAGGVG